MDLNVTAPERRNALRLDCGRILAWSEWGPPGGSPVLFCTGAGMSGYLGFGPSDVHRLGLRFIVLDRPGLGRSDPHPDKTLSSWADDIAEWSSAEGLRDPTAVGFSQGAPFALALAGRSLVERVAIVSGQDELAHPRVAPLLHPEVAAMVASAEQDPAEFERHFAEIATADVLWQLILEMSADRDRSAYAGPTFGPMFRHALEEGFSQGPRGYARDLVNTFRRWDVQPEDVSIPVHLWYGRRDTSTVHSPDFGATLASRLRQAELTVYDDEGGSVLWTRSGEILEHLTARVAQKR